MFDYWRVESLSCRDGLPLTRPRKYLTFEVDQGGLNNIRMAFEYAVVVAAVTGRTLVLPPPQSWYLLHHGPTQEKPSGGYCGFADIFDIDALSQAVPTITSAAFVRAEHRRLGIDASFCDATSPFLRETAPAPVELL
jgi:hypothetical protein